MRLLGKLAIGGGAISAVTAGALVVGGVFATSATLVVVSPAIPAHADGLTAFNDCSQLRSWFVDHNLADVGPYGWGGPVMYAMKELAPVPMAATDSAATPQSGQGSSATGTNTQEADVDEPDIAKTDGKLLVRLTKPNVRGTDQILAVSDVTGPTKNTLGRLHLPQSSFDSQLLLVGTHVFVTQSVSGYGYGGPIRFEPAYRLGLAGSSSTRVLDVDISDPAHPRIDRVSVYSGSLISARQYGSTVRLVTDTGRPELKWLYPGKNVSTDQATAHNRLLVKNSTIEDWLPWVKDAGHKARLLDCSQVLHPTVWSGSDTVAVTTFAADAPADRTSVGITASGGVVYSSTHRLYVASTRWDQPVIHPGIVEPGLRSVPEADARIMAPNNPETDLHAFALDGLKTSYVGSGHIRGMIRDRWSLDEYQGNLRVAWTRQNREGGTQNGISVLAEKNHQLDQIGVLAGLGVNEDIQAVRWFDDLAVLVTYRQIDPLYTIDLSDPTAPRTLGALKIPGYSGYLHPIGNGLLLGLGVNAGTDVTASSQAAVFDIKDVTHPRRLSRQGFGLNSNLPAMNDPLAFTWLPDAHTGLTVVSTWQNSGFTTRDTVRLVALEVGADGALTTRTVAQLHEGWQTRVLPLDDGRVAVVDGNQVQLVDLG